MRGSQSDSTDHVTWLDRPRKVLGDAAIVAAASATRETHVLAPVDATPRAVPVHVRMGLAA